MYFRLLLINISNSNNPTALSEHCCTPESYQSSPLNNNEQVKHLATGINNDRTWWFFLAKHIYNDFPTNHEQPWKLTFLFVFAFVFERTVKVCNYLKYHWIDTSFPRLVEQSDLLTLYNFEANPNYLFVTGLCYILKFLKQLQIPKQSLLGNFWIARTVNTLPTLEPLIKNESRNSMSFNNWSNIVVVY